jgi:phage-related baseplate assembly protein
VNVYVIAADGQPVASDVILNLLTFYKTADVVPLTDVPSVIDATVISYDLNLTLVIARGPDPNLIIAQATSAVRACANSVYKIGQTAYANALPAAARVGGVLNVTSDSITDIACDGTEVPWLRNLTINTQDSGPGSTPPADTLEPVVDGGTF